MPAPKVAATDPKVRIRVLRVAGLVRFYAECGCGWRSADNHADRLGAFAEREAHAAERGHRASAF